MAFQVPNTIEFGSEITSAEHEQNYQAIQNDLNSQVIRRDGSVAMSGALTLAGAPTASAQAANKAYVDALIPLGVAFPFFGATAPDGFAFAEGQTLARASFPQLAAMIAPTSGSAYWIDATNFRLPDMRTRAAVGRSAGTFAATLGATGGSKDSVVVSHNHTSPAHGHGLTLAMQEGGSHSHSAVGGTGQFIFRDGAYSTGFAIPWNTSASGGVSPIAVSYSSPSTSNGAHSHSMSGSSVNNGTATVDWAGVAGTDKNLQPYIVCNFIMRLA
jgi:microcystin-dependent protein